MLSLHSGQVGVIGDTHLPKRKQAQTGEETLGGLGSMTPKPGSVLYLLFPFAGSWELELFCPLRGLGRKRSGVVAALWGWGKFWRRIKSQYGVDRS